MHECKTVTLRTRPLKGRMMSFYLDYYPGYRDKETMKVIRHESLGIYIYANPKNKREQNFNEVMTDVTVCFGMLRHGSRSTPRFRRGRTLRELLRRIPGDEVEHGKPFPDIYQKAADMLGVNIKHTLVIRSEEHTSELQSQR